MKNQIFKITKEELMPIKKQLKKQKGTWIAEIDGKKISNWVDYSHEIERVFLFPTSCYKSVDVYLDWIRDLDWLNSEAFVLIIHNFSQFMSKEIELKNKIIKLFVKYIFPWWESEVEECVVEGKAKPFIVYLVD